MGTINLFDDRTMERDMGLFDETFKRATVKVFFTGEDRQYGFAKPDEPTEDDRDVYFNYGSAGRPHIRGSVEDIELRSHPGRMPITGDGIFYLPGLSSKGPRSEGWMFEDELKLVQAGQKLRFTFDEAEFRLIHTRRVIIESRQDGLIDARWMFKEQLMASGCLGIQQPHVRVLESDSRAETTLTGRNAQRLRWIGVSEEFHRVGGA